MIGKYWNKIYGLVIIIYVLAIHFIILQVHALFGTLELHNLARSKSYLALYNCLVLGHTKYNEVQWMYCNPFPQKPVYESQRLDLVMTILRMVTVI
jgi:hypothetical protein